MVIASMVKIAYAAALWLTISVTQTALPVDFYHSAFDHINPSWQNHRIVFLFTEAQTEN